MASRPKNHAEEVFDLRDDDTGDGKLDLLYRLRYMWPNSLEEARTEIEKEKQNGQGNDTTPMTTGIDCAVLVIRHIFGMMPRSFGGPSASRDQGTRDAVKTAEKDCLLLQYAWLNIPRPQDPLAMKRVLWKQMGWLKAFAEVYTERCPSFFSIVQGQSLRAGLWGQGE